MILFVGSKFSDCTFLMSFGAGAVVPFFGTGAESGIKNVIPIIFYLSTES